MKFHPTDLPGCYLIDIEPRADDRGFFARAWCQKEMAEHGLAQRLAQINTSFSTKRGTVRGMHFQLSPFREAKMIRVLSGAIYDVVIDLRQDSPHFGQWRGFKLDADKRQMIYVPEGFAHGFQTLENNTEMMYFVSEFYTPEAERGLRWNDPFFAIDWPIKDGITISPRDIQHPDFSAKEFGR